MKSFRLLIAWAAVTPVLQVAAQTPVTSQPLAPNPSQRLPYQSAFADYRPFREVDVGDWKALNEHLRKSAAARAMPMPGTTPVNPATPTTSPMPMPPMKHGGMK